MAIVLTTYTLLWQLYLPLIHYYGYCTYHLDNTIWPTQNDADGPKWLLVDQSHNTTQHQLKETFFLWRTGQYIKIWRKGLKGSKGIQNYFLSLKRTFISVLPFFASSRKQILPRSPLGGDKKDEIKSTAWCWVVEMTEVMQGTRFLPQSSRPLSVFC